MMEWLDGNPDSMDMNVSKLQEIVKDGETRGAAVHDVTKSQTWLSDWTEHYTKNPWYHYLNLIISLRQAC